MANPGIQIPSNGYRRILRANEVVVRAASEARWNLLVPHRNRCKPLFQILGPD